jgi:hypothetical protein
MNVIVNIIFIFIVYSLYVQFSSTMGNIWLRPDNNNIIVFCPMNLINLILQPFIKSYFWNYKFLPINFWFYLICYLVFYYNIIQKDISIK